MDKKINKDSPTTRNKEKCLVPSSGSCVAFEKNLGSREMGNQNTDRSFLYQHNRRKEQRLVSAYWLMDLLNITKSASRLKVILPYVISFDLVSSSLSPVTNILYDLVERLRLRHTDDNTVSIRSLLSPICRNSFAYFDPVIKLSTDLLVQSFVYLLEKHGVMDNCYIFPMKTGCQEECVETSTIVPQKAEIVKKCLQIRKGKEEKRIAQWNKVCDNIKVPKYRINEVTDTKSNVPKLDTTAESRSNPVITDVSNINHSIVGHGESGQNISNDIRIDDNAEFENKNQGKKKKELKKEFADTVGLMNDKKKDFKGNVETSRSKMKKILLSRKDDNKKLNHIVQSSSNSSIENQFEYSSKENFVQPKEASAIETSKHESIDAKLSGSINEEEPSTSIISTKEKNKKKKVLTGSLKTKRTQFGDDEKRVSLKKRVKIRLGLSKTKPCTQALELQDVKEGSPESSKEIEKENINKTETDNRDREQSGFFNILNIEEETTNKKKNKLHMKRRLKKTFGIKKVKDQKVSTESEVEKHNTASKTMSKALRNLKTEERRLLNIVDEDHAVPGDGISDTDIHIGIIDDLSENKDDKKEKRGLKRKVTAPFRWIKKKF